MIKQIFGKASIERKMKESREEELRKVILQLRDAHKLPVEKAMELAKIYRQLKGKTV